jgi:peptide/nickel transport system permease protein
VLPASITSPTACTLASDPHSCLAGCTFLDLNPGWQNVGCDVVGFGSGFAQSAWNIFSGNWGLASFGALREPVATFFQWWLAPSIELAVVALGLSALVGYPVGLRAGWRPDGWFDTGARFSSVGMLLLPTFLIVLVVLGWIYLPFTHAFGGDEPYGFLPGQNWFLDHGGFPPWIGPGENTLPTGFPLVDGAIHADWPFEFIVLLKTLFQASLIALVYVAVFLRYARHAVAERAQSMPILAARARGVPEGRLLWHHAAAEVWPVYILVFGITLPIYIGTQAIVEALFNDQGVGRVLIVEMTQAAKTGFGVHVVAGATSGNLYQVAIFLLLFVVLVGSLCSDILAQYLDPRLAKENA